MGHAHDHQQTAERVKTGDGVAKQHTTRRRHISDTNKICGEGRLTITLTDFSLVKIRGDGSGPRLSTKEIGLPGHFIVVSGKLSK